MNDMDNGNPSLVFSRKMIILQIFFLILIYIYVWKFEKMIQYFKKIFKLFF